MAGRTSSVPKISRISSGSELTVFQVWKIFGNVSLPLVPSFALAVLKIAILPRHMTVRTDCWRGGASYTSEELQHGDRRGRPDRGMTCHRPTQVCDMDVTASHSNTPAVKPDILVANRCSGFGTARWSGGGGGVGGRGVLWAQTHATLQDTCPHPSGRPRC